MHGKFPYYKNQNKIKMKISFVKRKNLLNPEQSWFYTEINGSYVSDSGSYEEATAKSRFFSIVANGGITELKEIIEEQIVE